MPLHPTISSRVTIKVQRRPLDSALSVGPERRGAADWEITMDERQRRPAARRHNRQLVLWNHRSQEIEALRRTNEALRRSHELIARMLKVTPKRGQKLGDG